MSSVAPSKAHVVLEMHAMRSSDKQIKDIRLPTYKQKMFAEKHNAEKLTISPLIVGTGLIVYHFV